MYTGSLEAFSNRADWKAQYRVIDNGPEGSGEDIDLTGCSVVLAVYDTEGNCIRLSGSTEGGNVTLMEYTTGIFSVISWSFDKSLTRGLCAGSYNVGVTISNDDQTMQLFIGTVPVLNGNVP